MTPTRARLARRFAVVAAVLLLVAAAAVWWTRPRPIPVTAHTVERGLVEATVANTRAGTVESCQRAKLSTILGGRIEVLAVKEGDRVKKGQLLMRLWNDDLRAAERLAAAGLESARRRVGEVCTMADAAQRELQRQLELHQQGFISANALDSARATAEARAAGCATAKADVAHAEANVRLARVQQGRTELTAPFDGTVAKIVGEVGEYSTPSPPGVPTPPAIELIDEGCLYVSAPMDEIDAPKIREGQRARITLDALPGRSFPGTVRRIAPYVLALEKQARTVDIEVTFDDAAQAGRLLVGYSADVEVILDLRDSVLRIPTAALLEGGRVWLIGADGRLQQRTVQTGLANWEHTEIVAGLQPGDRIVTSLDRAGIRPGAPVIVEPLQ